MVIVEQRDYHAHTGRLPELVRLYEQAGIPIQAEVLEEFRISGKPGNAGDPVVRSLPKPVTSKPGQGSGRGARQNCRWRTGRRSGVSA